MVVLRLVVCVCVCARACVVGGRNAGFSVVVQQGVRAVCGRKKERKTTPGRCVGAMAARSTHLLLCWVCWGHQSSNAVENSSNARRNVLPACVVVGGC